MEFELTLGEDQIKKILECCPELILQMMPSIISYPDVLEMLMMNHYFVDNLPKFRLDIIKSRFFDVDNLDNYIYESGEINETTFSILSEVLDLYNNCEMRNQLFLFLLSEYPAIRDRILNIGLDFSTDSRMLEEIFRRADSFDLCEQVIREYPNIIQNIEAIEYTLCSNRVDYSRKSYLLDILPELPEQKNGNNIISYAIGRREFFHKLLTTHFIRFSSDYNFYLHLFVHMKRSDNFTKEDFILLLERTNIDIKNMNCIPDTLISVNLNSNYKDIINVLFDLGAFDKFSSDDYSRAIDNIMFMDPNNYPYFLNRLMSQSSYVLNDRDIAIMSRNCKDALKWIDNVK